MVNFQVNKYRSQSQRGTLAIRSRSASFYMGPTDDRSTNEAARPDQLTARIVLPDGYYLEHFLDHIDTINRLYRSFLNGIECTFLDSFLSLSDLEQRLFVRISNRKGTVFFREKLKYNEIPDIEKVIDSLLEKGFLRPPASSDMHLLLRAMQKQHILSLLESLEGSEPIKRSWPRDLLVSKASSLLRFERIAAHPVLKTVVMQRFAEQLAYFSFLALGEIESDLKLYTLRDLGIRRVNSWNTKSKVRFEGPEQARSEFFFRLARHYIREEGFEVHIDQYLDKSSWPAATSPGAERAREKLAWDLAIELLQSERHDDAIQMLADEQSPRSIEKHTRLLFSHLGPKAAKARLEEIFSNPPNSETLLFAEDFWARKFDGRKVGAVTTALRKARTVLLDGTFRGAPERGVKNHFTDQGYYAARSENYLWSSLFGILFWESLFEAESAAIHSPFDRMPADLINGDFYQRNFDTVEKILADLESFERTSAAVSQTISRHYGTLNGIFSWHTTLEGIITTFLKHAIDRRYDLALVLRTMAKDFGANSRGFPDLFVVIDGSPTFFEVKTEGDTLSRTQLQKLILLSEAGFSSEIVRVLWTDKSDQTYVVVDVETTGMSPSLDRITEVGAVRIQGGTVVATFQTLVNPGRHIPRRIVELTGITNEMVSTAPKFADVAQDFLTFVGESVFVAHNVRFDYGFIANEFRRLGTPFRRPVYCTCVGSKRAFPGLHSYSLRNLCKHFGIELNDHHRALNDAHGAAQLLLRLLGVAAGSTPEKNGTEQQYGAAS